MIHHDGLEPVLASRSVKNTLGHIEKCRTETKNQRNL